MRIIFFILIALFSFEAFCQNDTSNKFEHILTSPAALNCHQSDDGHIYETYIYIMSGDQIFTAKYSYDPYEDTSKMTCPGLYNDVYNSKDGYWEVVCARHSFTDTKFCVIYNSERIDKVSFKVYVIQGENRPTVVRLNVGGKAFRVNELSIINVRRVDGSVRDIDLSDMTLAGLVDEMRKGGKLRIVDSDGYTREVPLSGFSEAYDLARIGLKAIK